MGVSMTETCHGQTPSTHIAVIGIGTKDASCTRGGVPLLSSMLYPHAEVMRHVAMPRLTRRHLEGL